METVGTLLHGAIDLHHHGYPEISFGVPTGASDVEELIRCRNAGMRGVVLKSHMWPTVGRVFHLRDQVPDFEIFSSITLNEAVGGFSPLAVESAAAQGASVVFMPTWSAAHDREKGGMSAFLEDVFPGKVLSPGRGLVATDGNGRLRGEVVEVLDVAREHRMVVCTGHLSPSESLALADHAGDDIALVFSHPDSHSVGGSWGECVEMVARGARVELCALGLMPAFGRVNARQFADLVRQVGSRNCLLTSDYFFDWAPSASDMLRILVQGLRAAEIGADEIREMACAVPARLLGLSE